MEQTPIRVRGKRGNRILNSVKKAQDSFGSRLASTTAASNSVPKGRSKPGLTLSKLERLPNELLQRIFLYSFNFDLPATSVHLARVLNGPGAHYLELEYSFRALYKPLSQLGTLWHTHGDLIVTKLGTSRPVTSDEVQVNSHNNGPEDGALDNGTNVPDGRFEQTTHYSEAKAYVLRRLHIARWKQYRSRAVQERLINSRFFSWGFMQRLISRAHEVFRKEIADTRAALSLGEDAMSKKERWWMSTSAEVLLRGMQHLPSISESVPDFKQHYRLPWLQFKSDVRIPRKCTRGPWADGEDNLLFWLTRGGCGRDLAASGLRSDEPRLSLLPLPVSMLSDAVQLNQVWIVHQCAVRAGTPPSTEMLRQALTTKPFPFVVVQNLIYAARSPVRTMQTLQTIDSLDPQVWSFIEHQGQREAEQAKYLEKTSRIEDCISVSKWLQHQLRQLDVQSVNLDARCYLPSRPAIGNVLDEWADQGSRWDTIGQVPHHAQLRKILITPTRHL